jgi:effector-binding domain-containing protein
MNGMILHLGVRTTQKVKVAYKILTPEDKEASVIAKLLSILTRQNPINYNIFDHSMIVYYDPPEIPNRRRELLIPTNRSAKGIEIRELPSMKVAFLVFKGTDKTVEEYYEYLKEYMAQSNLVASNDIYSIEVMYVPESVDEQDYTIEIMIPITN